MNYLIVVINHYNLDFPSGRSAENSTNWFIIYGIKKIFHLAWKIFPKHSTMWILHIWKKFCESNVFNELLNSHLISRNIFSVRERTSSFDNFEWYRLP